MNNLLRHPILYFALLSIFIFSCQSHQDKKETSEALSTEMSESRIDPEEDEIKATVEKILLAAGNANLEELDDLSSDNAIIGYSYKKDGIWLNNEMTIKEYIEGKATADDLKPFSEIPTEFDIIITEGRLAIVRADAILSIFGIPRNREINHLTLIKENKGWKLLSIAWTVERLTDEQRKFDLDLFAHSYAQAWGSKRPEFVAMFFEEDGVLQVNDGDPAIGRDAIANVAKGFMTDLPDMIVRFDSLVPKTNGTEFHWTLIATNTGPGGTGNKVKVSGYELWQIDEDGLINNSLGNFPTEEYNRQLEFGIEN